MSREACAAFLAWALPELGLAAKGYRRVRRQVCRRIGQRAAELRLPDLTAYRSYLEARPAEWEVLAGFCRIPISRFYRDAPVFDALGLSVLPALAQNLEERGGFELSAWSAGCASGEEPYSVALLWHFRLAAHFPGIALRILATDADPGLLERAQRACYRRSSLKELPNAWRTAAFEPQNDHLCLKEQFRRKVEFEHADLCGPAPTRRFDLVLCRNVAFTYFDPAGRHRALARLIAALEPGGALVIGRKEGLPAGAAGLLPWDDLPCIYRRQPEDQAAAANAASNSAASAPGRSA